MKELQILFRVRSRIRLLHYFQLFGWIAEVFNCIVVIFTKIECKQRSEKKNTWDLNKTFCKTLKRIWTNKRPNWKYYYFFERWDFLLEIHTLDNKYVIVYQYQKLSNRFLNEKQFVRNVQNPYHLQKLCY